MHRRSSASRKIYKIEEASSSRESSNIESLNSSGQRRDSRGKKPSMRMENIKTEESSPRSRRQSLPSDNTSNDLGPRLRSVSDATRKKLSLFRKQQYALEDEGSCSKEDDGDVLELDDEHDLSLSMTEC
jgi:hypothetical protein